MSEGHQVPGFQDFMLPMLRFLDDGHERTMSELYDAMAAALGVPDEERVQLLASGRQSRFDNRVGWAKTYLTKAGLLASPRRGAAAITSRGRSVLSENPMRIDIGFLQRFPEFVEFQQATKAPATQEAPVPSSALSPEEQLDAAYSALRAGVIQDLVQAMKSASPLFFEKLVLELLRRMGYGLEPDDSIHRGRPGDEGIDGVINQDKLGLDVIYIQAKRWDNPVGRQTIQAFAGSLEGQHANKGVLLTTSRFTSDALDYVSKISKKIVLIDGERLAGLLIDFKVGVQVVSTYENVRVDADFFLGELD